MQEARVEAQSPLPEQISIFVGSSKLPALPCFLTLTSQAKTLRGSHYVLLLGTPSKSLLRSSSCHQASLQRFAYSAGAASLRSKAGMRFAHLPPTALRGEALLLGSGHLLQHRSDLELSAILRATAFWPCAGLPSPNERPSSSTHRCASSDLSAQG